MNQTKKELSYFRLKLEGYLRDHHPELITDSAFIGARADLALSSYCDSVAQGFSHLEAEAMASEILYQGLHFSKYDTLVSILEQEFSEELPEPLPHRLAPILLGNKSIQAVFSKYDLRDDFDGSREYEQLYTELTGTIVLLIEENHLPIVDKAEMYAQEEDSTGALECQEPRYTLRSTRQGASTLALCVAKHLVPALETQECPQI